MAKAYAQTVHPRAFTKGQLVLRITEHVRKTLPEWEGPYIIKEAHNSGYY